jgi:hypothetical protein
MNIIYLAVLIKIILVLFQTIYVFPGTSFDADTFHLAAIDFSEHIDNNKPLSEYNYKVGFFYSIFLGCFYLIFGTSKIVGGLLSVLSWFLSAVVFRKVLLLLKLDDHKIDLSILCYVLLLPISFYYTTLMLREVYLLLFVNLLFLSIVSMALKEKFIIKIFYFVIFILSLTLLNIFHKAYNYFVIIFLGFILTYIIFNYLDKIVTIYLRLPKITWIFLFTILIVLINKFEILEHSFDIIVDYQRGHFYKNTIFRADYFGVKERVNLNYDFFAFLSLMFNNIFNYLLQPIPLKVTTFKDLVLFIENLIRFSILIYIILNLFKNFQMKYIYILGFMTLVIMEIIYASGTVNWGTASRHHVPIQGLLILLMFFPKKKIKT